ncbi:vacuolar-sorting protein SNF8-like [Corticium candelabrum]|uniref:vacuolar-sorting protein SNF8-like n=1 Tax=Corticium candelabrum TaxID=121492 RepID=UPI002E2677B6|nr:vacuolar-sorting protein SNF8-like [Corticium candelabrum]
MRRRGIGAIDKGKLAKAKFAEKGTEIAELQFSQMQSQLDTFRSNLEDFAAKHKNEIKKNAEFRQHFQQMCARIGVDPLASSKGFWAEMLGVGDFYYELGVQIIEVCLATRSRNGGLISLEELKLRLLKSRGKHGQDISNDDIIRAIKKLRVLGSGFAVIPIGDRRLIQSVPGELSMDHTAVLQHAENGGYVSLSDLVREMKWETTRASRALEHLVQEGMAWVDDQTHERQYWFPSLVPDL